MECVNGRVAVIAGAGDSISETIALKLANGGAKVAIVGDNATKVNAIGSKLRESGADCTSIVLNSNDKQAISKAINEVLTKFNRIDILVNAGNDANGKGISEATDEDWESAIKTNLTATFLYCREVIPHMRRNKHGRIVNLSSFYYMGWPGMVDYSASASGIFGLTRSLALELAKDNITVNCVAKGDILTLDSGLSVEDVSKLADSQPVKKLGTPQDVAHAVAYLSSDTSKYVTGQMLFVCGGRSLYSSMSA